mmetsp:Transcript_28758/g.42342  ORF Transcript_28758/g.42342 Transcript_28758/m.42342 type:complete len:203 (+) Transcript_28758:118-726(+)
MVRSSKLMITVDFIFQIIIIRMNKTKGDSMKMIPNKVTSEMECMINAVFYKHINKKTLWKEMRISYIFNQKKKNAAPKNVARSDEQRDVTRDAFGSGGCHSLVEDGTRTGVGGGNNNFFNCDPLSASQNLKTKKVNESSTIANSNTAAMLSSMSQPSVDEDAVMEEAAEMLKELQSYRDEMHSLSVKNTILMDSLLMAGAEL